MKLLFHRHGTLFSAIDLDGVEMPQLRDVFHQMNHDIIPKLPV